MKADYKKTVNACFIGYIVQAVVNNFVPLLFLTFQSQYGIPLSKITFLITFNFSIQLVIDLLAAKFVDKIGYRASALLAHASAALGLCMLAFLPELTKDPFIGILISVVVYAVGGGLLEVIVSPIVEACPTDNKEAAMSLLHSFYCWGHVGVVLLSTLFFRFVGIGHWKILACLWALVPLLNMLAFFKVPIAPIIEEGGQGLSFKELLKNKVFWLLMLLMLCAGSCEQAVSQWASAFAEAGLGISKTAGDLAGPMFFAIMMGLSRAFYGKYGDKMDPGTLYENKRGTMPLQLSSDLAFTGSGAKPDRMRTLRTIRGNPLAGNIQSWLRWYQRRWNDDVCILCTCRRCRMQRRAYLCRYSHFPVRWEYETGHFACLRVPDPAFSGADGSPEGG